MCMRALFVSTCNHLLNKQLRYIRITREHKEMNEKNNNEEIYNKEEKKKKKTVQRKEFCSYIVPQTSTKSTNIIERICCNRKSCIEYYQI